MDARKLVGMSETAKKEAARRLATSPMGVLPAGAYWDARALFRVGQRLRPCPGCEACILAGLNTGTMEQRARRMCSAIFAPHCDGYGVLPARKAVKR